MFKSYRVNKNLWPAAAAAAYEPVQKHKVTPSILGWLNNWYWYHILMSMYLRCSLSSSSSSVSSSSTSSSFILTILIIITTINIMKLEIQSSTVIARSNITYHIGTAAAVTELNHRLTSEKTPHTLPSWASYGVSFVRILEKIGRVLTAPHCTNHWQLFIVRSWNNGVPWYVYCILADEFITAEKQEKKSHCL